MSDVNPFKADLRELEFQLFEQFNLQGLFSAAPYDHFTEEDARMILKEGHTFASEVIGPTMMESDREGCELTPDGVKTPSSFKGLWKQFYESGWNGLRIPENLGGQGAPQLLDIAIGEMMSGANPAFGMYPSLSMGAADVIRAFGTPEQKEFYAPKIEDGSWGGTMVLTESNAGSDVGMSLTKASPNGDGSYHITGNKIFISGGDQDITENIIHLVLARIEGAPKGSRGLSLFIVPKHQVNPDGSLGEPNDVVCTTVEHKLGINASATAALAFGENGACLGYLVGGEPTSGEAAGDGMRKMFLMMNTARIAVGAQSLSVASTAYLNALAYARTRLQGAHITEGRPPSGAVPIIQHPDVRRMLLEMKATVEGCRALLYYTVKLMDQARVDGGDENQEDYASLLIPLVKAHISDMAVHVASMAIQVHGGAGYTKDYPVEQYLRDARIFPIYEGTNGIQALDLVGRKLAQNGGGLVNKYLEEMGGFISTLKEHKSYAAERGELEKAVERFNAVLGHYTMMGMQGQLENVALGATRFLEGMARMTLAKLLLEGALTAEAALANGASDSESKFYKGKIASARFYANNLLPLGTAQLEVLMSEDVSALELDEQGFSLVF